MCIVKAVGVEETLLFKEFNFEGNITFILVDGMEVGTETIHMSLVSEPIKKFFRKDNVTVTGDNIVFIKTEELLKIFEADGVIFNNSFVIIFSGLERISADIEHTYYDLTNTKLLQTQNHEIDLLDIILLQNISKKMLIKENDLFRAIYEAIGYNDIYELGNFIVPKLKDTEIRHVQATHVILHGLRDKAICKTFDCIMLNNYDVKINNNVDLLNIILNIDTLEFSELDYEEYHCVEAIITTNVIEFNIITTKSLIINNKFADINSDMRLIYKTGVAKHAIDILDIDVKYYIKLIKELSKMEITLQKQTYKLDIIILKYLLIIKTVLKKEKYKYVVTSTKVSDVCMLLKPIKTVNEFKIKLHNINIYPSFKLLADEFAEFKMLFKRHRVNMFKDKDDVVISVNGVTNLDVKYQSIRFRTYQDLLNDINGTFINLLKEE